MFRILSPLKKLDKRCSEKVLVGYSNNGYRLWDPKKRKIDLAHDVVFDEKKSGLDLESFKIWSKTGASSSISSGEQERIVDTSMSSSIAFGLNSLIWP